MSSRWPVAAAGHVLTPTGHRVRVAAVTAAGFTRWLLHSRADLSRERASRLAADVWAAGSVDPTQWTEETRL